MGDRIFTNSIEQSVSNWLDSFAKKNNQNTYSPKKIFSFTDQAFTSIIRSHKYLTTPTHLTALIKSLKNKKSAGHDEVPNTVIKKLPHKMINLISIIFNNCLRLCYFPETWKIAKILPIRKPNKLPTKLTSYRPISLLPCLGKLFEKVFNQWLQFEINRQAVIPDIQFGFRPLHSTVHAALTLTEDVIQGLIKTDNTIACFLDAEKAFDTVWTNGLIWKMIFKFKIDDSLCLLTYNYLNNRQFYVMANNKSSSTFNIAAGVPQGAIISPNLYSIFTADIPLNQCSLIKTIQYADDTVIYMSSKSLTHANLELNNHLNMLNDYYKLWKI